MQSFSFVFDDRPCHYVRSAVVCTDTDRLVNMVDPTLSPGLTPLTSPRTTYFIFTERVSSPHAVIGLLMWEHWCEGHPSVGNYPACSHFCS